MMGCAFGIPRGPPRRRGGRGRRAGRGRALMLAPSASGAFGCRSRGFQRGSAGCSLFSPCPKPSCRGCLRAWPAPPQTPSSACGPPRAWRGSSSCASFRRGRFGPARARGAPWRASRARPPRNARARLRRGRGGAWRRTRPLAGWRRARPGAASARPGRRAPAADRPCAALSSSLRPPRAGVRAARAPRRSAARAARRRPPACWQGAPAARATSPAALFFASATRASSSSRLRIISSLRAW
mmetsp:Transcript_8816/g.31083  ORF Transcript_8816/g.31083 Transcript_8816/m.31083 type:complete len:241 (+) Transcript_8816:44-766(+)